MTVEVAAVPVPVEVEVEGREDSLLPALPSISAHDPSYERRERIRLLAEDHPLSINVEYELNELTFAARPRTLGTILKQLNQPEYGSHSMVKAAMLAKTALYAAENLGTEQIDQYLDIAQEALDRFDEHAALHRFTRFSDRAYDSILAVRTILEQVCKAG